MGGVVVLTGERGLAGGVPMPSIGVSSIVSCGTSGTGASGVGLPERLAGESSTSKTASSPLSRSTSKTASWVGLSEFPFSPLSFFPFFFLSFRPISRCRESTRPIGG